VASLSSSPLGGAVDDVGLRGTSSQGGTVAGDVVLLTPPPRRCSRRAAAADKPRVFAAVGRQRCTRVLCALVAGLCVGVLGLVLGALVIARPAASLHYSESVQSHSYSSSNRLLLMSGHHFHICIRWCALIRLVFLPARSRCSH